MGVTSTSQVSLHELLLKEDAESWIVGRPDTGEFVEVPVEAITFLQALQDGEHVAAAHDRVVAQHDEDVDAVEFVDSLIELGFVASIDGRQIGAAPAPSSLRHLHSRHVQWAFRWPAVMCVYTFIVVGWIAAAYRNDLIPSYRAYFVSGWQSVNVAWNTAMVLAAIAVHEFWHLAAARAEGIHARIGLGTRLQFLVAQTTVPGLWGSSRRIRLRVYLAGVTSDLVIIAACSLTISIAMPTGFAYRSLEALILSLLLSIANQFALYMRTDMYFVLQELLRCKNLYADAWDYARYAGHKLLAITLRTKCPSDPTSAVPRHERTPIKVYAILMVFGSCITLAAFVYYEGPILISLFVRASLHAIVGIRSGSAPKVADGVMVIGIEGTLQVIFFRLVLTKHGQKLRAAIGWLRWNGRPKANS